MNHEAAVETLAAERYLLGDMPPDEREAFEAHFFECAECADEVRIGGVMTDGVRSGLLSPTARKRTTARLAWRPAIAIPWAAAAGFALLAGFESVHTGSHPVTAPLALAPMTLRPATRGDEAVVAAGPGGAVTLAVALPGGADGRVQYELRRGDALVAAGDAPAPSAGAPLLLMVPDGVLNPGDHCVLAVKNLRNADLTTEEYRFRVEGR